MGYSYLTYGEEHSRFYDTDIEIIIYMVDKTLKKNKDSFSLLLSEKVENWADHVRNDPVSKDFGLEEYENSTELISILNLTKNQIEKFGESIPKDLLNELSQSKIDRFLGDYEVARLSKAVDRMLDLIKNTQNE